MPCLFCGFYNETVTVWLLKLGHLNRASDIFRADADLPNSGISAKSPEISKKVWNTAKSTRNISKYMSAKHI